MRDALLTVAQAIPEVSKRHLPPDDAALWGVEPHAARQYAIDHALSAVAQLLERVEADRIARAMDAEMRRLSDMNNARFGGVAQTFDFGAVNQLRDAFKARYATEFQDVAFALALRYPQDVRIVHMSANSPIPIFEFNETSPITGLFDWDVVSSAVQRRFKAWEPEVHVYVPYVVHARGKLRDLRRGDTIRELCGHKFF